MRLTLVKLCFTMAAIVAFLCDPRLAHAADAPVVNVKYATGDTELDHLTQTAKFFIGKPDTLKKFPTPLRRLMFTRRPADIASDVTIDAPKGAKVFIIIETGEPTADCRKVVVDAGWKWGNFATSSAGMKLDVYSMVCADDVHLTIPARGTTSIVVASAKLEVEPNDTAGKPAVANATTKPSVTAAVPAVLPGGPPPKTAPPKTAPPKTAQAKVEPPATPVEPSAPTVIQLGGQVDQIRTGGGGHFLAFHIKDSNQLTIVDVLAGKVVKKIPAEGDICYCMDRDKLVLVLNNQQVIQRWDLATLTREKTVMLPDDRPVKRAIMGSASAGPLMLWTDGSCKIFSLTTLRPLTVNGTVQNSFGFGPWVSSDGMTICDWGWSGGPYSLMRLSNLTATSIDSRVVNVDSEGYNESWAMPSADGTQLIRHGACVYDASTDELVALAAGPLKDATVLPTEDPRFLLAVRGEDEGQHTSSVAILSAFDRRVLYTFHKAAPVTGGMIGTRSGRICSEPRVHYLPADNKLVLIPNSDDKVVVYPFDLTAALKATGADYLYVISKPHTVLTVGQKFDYQIETLSSAAGIKFKLEEGPPGLAVSEDGHVTWKATEPTDASKVPVVITLSDSAGDEITHAIELHVIPKVTAVPGAPAPALPDKTASAGKQKPAARGQTKPPVASAAPTPAPKKIPDDPELKALGDKLSKKFQEDLDADSRGNNEYTSTFSIYVGNATRSATDANVGHMTLTVHEDRAFLIGGDFIAYTSHVDVELKKVNGLWTCTTAKSTLDMASTSHGPMDMPFPPKTHDMTRSMRGLLDDVQDDPEPKKDAPKPQPDRAPAQKA